MAALQYLYSGSYFAEYNYRSFKAVITILIVFFGDQNTLCYVRVNA